MRREDFPLDPSVVFLNHGSFGACPTVLLNEQTRWQHLMETEPVAFFYDLPARMQAAREALAGYVHADRNDLVFVQNSTYGVNVMAHAMARYLKPGDEVLVPDHEYGACQRAWQFHLKETGITIAPCHIPIPLPTQDEVAELVWSAVTPRTRVLYISHITSPTASRLPVEKLAPRAREAGILMLVDGAHAPGHIALDLRQLDVDGYTGNLHKWMCTPKGSAMLWLRPDLQPHVPPLIGSWGNHWLSVGDGEFIDEHEYVGTRDTSAFLTTQQALQWMEEQPWNEVLEHGRRLVRYGMEGLLGIKGMQPVSADWEEHGLLMGAVIMPGDRPSDEVQRWMLHQHRIQLICMDWLGTSILRFCAHGYTTREEIDVLVRAVGQLVG
jgi:isopenicillin-N epimerase